MLSDEQGLKKSECIPQECDGCRKCIVTCLVKTQQENTKKRKTEKYYPKAGKRNRECYPKAGKRNRVTEVGRVALNLNGLPTENT